MITQQQQETLITAAENAQKKAYAPYSNFFVGVALLTEDGEIFTGCNVENVSLGLSNCGERTAIFKMVSEKGPHTKIKALALSIPYAPCGACRQVIQEFASLDTVIIYPGPEGYSVTPLATLFPEAFTDFVAG